MEQFDNFKNNSDLDPGDRIRDFLVTHITSPEQRRLAYQAIKLFYKIVIHKECPYILDKVKRNKRLPTVLSHDEIMTILDNIKNNIHYSMISLLYAAGLRVSEVVKLKVHDLLLDQLRLYVRRSKGHKDRISLISDKLLSGLEDLVKNRGENEYLFLTQQKKKYTIRTVQAIFKNALKKSGVQKNATCHTLRHSFATHLIESGTNIKSVQNKTEILLRISVFPLNSVISQGFSTMKIPRNLQCI